MTWSNKRLTELADYINGYAFKPHQLGRDGLPVIRIEQLKNPKSINDYYDGLLPDHNIIDDGDLIFSWSASLFLDIWKHGKSALNQHLFKVIPKEGINKAFLKYLIEYYLPQIANAAHGSTMQHITRKELNNFHVRIPDGEDLQEAIAEIISSADKLLLSQKEKLAKQKRIKTGLMQDLLTKGIDEQGNIRSEETHEFKDSPLGRIPVEWDVFDIGELQELITSGSRGWARYYAPEGSLFMRIGNLTREHINFRFDDVVRVDLKGNSSEGQRTKLLGGDILISITADLGIIGVVPRQFEEAYINQHIALIRIDQNEHSSRWIGYYLSSVHGQEQIRKLNDSGAKAGINLPTICSLIVAIPKNKSEQDLISLKFDDLDKAIEQIKIKIEKTKRVKRGLMQDLLSGNRDISHLDIEELTQSLTTNLDLCNQSNQG